MQSFQGTLSSASSPILHSNGSASPSTPPIPSHLSVSQGPPTQVAQLKLPTVSAGSADSSKLLGKTSPVPKIQQKIGASLPIPTAHITPFMSQSWVANMPRWILPSARFTSTVSFRQEYYHCLINSWLLKVFMKSLQIKQLHYYMIKFDFYVVGCAKIFIHHGIKFSSIFMTSWNHEWRHRVALHCL